MFNHVMAPPLRDCLATKEIDVTGTIDHYFDLLLAADSAGLAALFTDAPEVDDPRGGRVQGRPALEQFVAATSAWLQESHADIEHVATVTDQGRQVGEWVVHVDGSEGRWPLPVAVVADRKDTGVECIRVYHSMWPLIGRHEVRAGLLPANPEIVLTGAVADYQRALAAGDVDGVLAAFDPDATVREPSGGPYVFRGRDALREIYSLMFANGGGIALQHCTATDDGIACAIEYNAVRWGKDEIPPQAGIAVYERGPSGRLAAARIYDDVTPPAVSDSTEGLGR